MFEHFTEEQIEVLSTALEFLEDRYLSLRAQYIRDELINEITKVDD